MFPPQLIGVVLPVVVLMLVVLTGVDAGTEPVLKLRWLAKPSIVFLFSLTTVVHFSINFS